MSSSQHLNLSCSAAEILAYLAKWRAGAAMTRKTNKAIREAGGTNCAMGRCPAVQHLSDAGRSCTDRRHSLCIFLTRDLAR